MFILRGVFYTITTTTNTMQYVYLCCVYDSYIFFYFICYGGGKESQPPTTYTHTDKSFENKPVNESDYIFQLRNKPNFSLNSLGRGIFHFSNAHDFLYLSIFSFTPVVLVLYVVWKINTTYHQRQSWWTFIYKTFTVSSINNFFFLLFSFSFHFLNFLLNNKKKIENKKRSRRRKIRIPRCV